MRPVIRMHACDYDRRPAHGAQWQKLELIFGRLFQHGNMLERRERSSMCNVHFASLRPAETFMPACCRPIEKARFRERKCANTQLIVAGIQRFLQHAYAAHIHVIHTCKTLCALCIFTQTLIGIFFVHAGEVETLLVSYC